MQLLLRDVRTRGVALFTGCALLWLCWGSWEQLCVEMCPCI